MRLKVFLSIIFQYSLITQVLCFAKEESFNKSKDIKNDLDHFLFDPTNPNLTTDSALIVHKNKIQYEHYKAPYSKDKKHICWSVTKSIINIVYGMLIYEKKISLDQSICHFGYKHNCQVTINDLLHWSSGLDWQETYEKTKHPSESHVLSMLYGPGASNMGDYVTHQKKNFAPGTNFKYSSGDSNLLMGIVKYVLKEKNEDYIYNHLFARLQISDITWEQDKTGAFVGASNLFARPRDLAKLGTLFMNKGLWKGQRFFASNWYQFSSTASNKITDWKYLKESSALPGVHWWLNKGISSIKKNKKWLSLPDDIVYAAGHWGQRIYILPSFETVVVRTGNDRNNKFDEEKFLNKVINLIQNIDEKEASEVLITYE